MRDPAVQDFAGRGPCAFRLDRIPPQPWKNGGGTTREIACWPAQAGMDDFLWRVSVARVAADGPFSRFPGVDRVITLLRGPGLRLRGELPDGGHALTEALAPYAFDGGATVLGLLAGGASDDLNLMYRRGQVRGQVQVLRSAGVLAGGTGGVLLAVAGRWQVHGPCGQGWCLAPDEGLWWGDGPAGAWTVAPQQAQHDGPPGPGAAALVAISIHPAGASGGQA